MGIFCSLSFGCCMLAVTVSNLTLCNALESLCDWRIHWFFFLSFMSSSDIPSVVCSCYSFLSPAYFCMLAKIAGGFSISGVKVLVHHPAIDFCHTTCCGTLKNMDTTVLDVLNGWCLFKKHIHQWVPILWEPLCSTFVSQVWLCHGTD